MLDEPASGLDPRARIEIRGLLKELRKLGKTIMVSSHILPELADICNKVGIIEHGVLLVSAEVADVMKLVRQRTLLHVGVVGDPQPGRQAPGGRASWSRASRSATAGSSSRWPKGVEDYSDLPTLLVQAGHKLTVFKEDEINLETAFMALTKGITA